MTWLGKILKEFCLFTSLGKILPNDVIRQNSLPIHVIRQLTGLGITYIYICTYIVLLPADKGSRVVIIDCDQYISLAEEILADTNTYKERNKGNPLKYRMDKLNLRLRQIQAQLPAANNGAPSKLLDHFIIKEPSLQNVPYAYFLPKVHKTYPPSNFVPLFHNAQPLQLPFRNI